MRGAWTLLLALIFTALLGTEAQASRDRHVLLVLVDDLSYEEALADPVLGSLASAGGIGLMATRPEDEVSFRSDLEALARMRAKVEIVEGAGRVTEAIQQSGADEVLVLVAVPSVSPELRRVTGAVTPLILARGSPDALLGAGGPAAGLTSDTTRRDGIVSNVDVIPTVLEFLGGPVREGEVGTPIRVEGEAPTALNARYVEYRRVVTPVAVIVLVNAIASLVAALVLLLFMPSAPRGLAGTVAIWGLAAVALFVALLPGSVLPDYSYPAVVVTLAVAGAFITALALRWGREDVFTPVVVVAGAGLALVAVDGILGWPSGLTPLMGGSALEGVRFLGLGNSDAGVVMAGAVLVAAGWPPVPGVALILLAALFAGLPFFGADLGGGVTMFAVAGLWYGIRARPGPAWRAVVIAVAAALAGLGTLLLTHRLLPPGGTHVSRAVEEAGGVGGLLDVFLDRFGLNIEVTAATPAVWLALAGLPVWVWVAWGLRGPFRAPLERTPAWREAAIVLAVGGMIGYVLNDTYGMATVTFVFVSAALVYPALRVRWTSA